MSGEALVQQVYSGSTQQINQFRKLVSLLFRFETCLSTCHSTIATSTNTHNKSTTFCGAMSELCRLFLSCLILFLSEEGFWKFWNHSSLCSLVACSLLLTHCLLAPTLQPPPLCGCAHGKSLATNQFIEREWLCGFVKACVLRLSAPLGSHTTTSPPWHCGLALKHKLSVLYFVLHL